MKAYTDLSQSKKLAEILPIVSADMWYSYYGHPGYNSVIAYKGEQWFLCQIRNSLHNDIPCWSLAALLDFLESEIDGENGETYKLNIEKDGTWWEIWYEEYNDENPIEPTSSEELIDVCYKMILKLKERKLI